MDNSDAINQIDRMLQERAGGHPAARAADKEVADLHSLAAKHGVSVSDVYGHRIGIARERGEDPTELHRAFVRHQGRVNEPAP